MGLHVSGHSSASSFCQTNKRLHNMWDATLGWFWISNFFLSSDMQLCVWRCVIQGRIGKPLPNLSFFYNIFGWAIFIFGTPSEILLMGSKILNDIWYKIIGMEMRETGFPCSGQLNQKCQSEDFLSPPFRLFSWKYFGTFAIKILKLALKMFCIVIL